MNNSFKRVFKRSLKVSLRHISLWKAWIVFDWRRNLSSRRGISVLIEGAFEQPFGPEGREFEQANLQKFKCLGGGCPGGMLKLQFDWYININQTNRLGASLQHNTMFWKPTKICISRWELYTDMETDTNLHKRSHNMARCSLSERNVRPFWTLAKCSSSVVRASDRCTEGHGFDSRRGLRFFLCPTLATCWIFHLFLSNFYSYISIARPCFFAIKMPLIEDSSKVTEVGQPVKYHVSHSEGAFNPATVSAEEYLVDKRRLSYPR